jgi:hypothetical protein
MHGANLRGTWRDGRARGRQTSGVRARLLVFSLAFGAGLVAAPAVGAQILPPPTTGPPPTTAPSTSSPSTSLLDVPTTAAPATTTTAAATTSTTRPGATTSTTKKPAATSSTTVFVPPEGQQATTTTVTFAAPRSRAGTRLLPVFVLLSIAGFALAIVIVAAQVLGTRR